MNFMEKRLRDGRQLLIREAVRDDAPALVAYFKVIGGESDYLTFGAEGLDVKEEDEAAVIEAMAAAANQLMLCAFVDGNLAGNLSFRGGTRERIRHSGELGISVHREYWGLGIGHELLGELIRWARESGIIRKLNLRVRADNTRAIALYEKIGFQREGVITREFLVNGKFYDTYLMGLELD